MSEPFNMDSVELSRGRGKISPNELLRLVIATDSPELPCHNEDTGTFQHIMIHDRWLGHLETCDDCKDHVLRLLMDVHTRINLFSRTAFERLLAGTTTEALQKAVVAAGPEVSEKIKAAL